MATRNDITGDDLISKVPSKQYMDNYDAIFRKPKDDHFNELLKDPIDGFNETKDNNYGSEKIKTAPSR